MSRVAFTIFGIDVMWYGVLMGVGMLLGIFIALKEAKRVGFKEDDILNLALIIIPISLICARIYYVVFSWDFYGQNPGEILNFRGGGLAIHGAIIGGFITTVVYSRVKNLKFLKLIDIIALCMPLAQAIGRWGNFINGEAHGGPTDLPWGITVDGVKVHPTFLYESIWDFCLFLFLFFRRKNKKFDGEQTFLYFIIYSVGRFFIEGLRTDSLMFGPIRMAQFISLMLIIAGVVGLVVVGRKKRL